MDPDTARRRERRCAVRGVAAGAVLLALAGCGDRRDVAAERDAELARRIETTDLVQAPPAMAHFLSHRTDPGGTSSYFNQHIAPSVTLDYATGVPAGAISRELRRRGWTARQGSGGAQRFARRDGGLCLMVSLVEEVPDGGPVVVLVADPTHAECAGI